MNYEVSWIATLRSLGPIPAADKKEYPVCRYFFILKITFLRSSILSKYLKNRKTIATSQYDMTSQIFEDQFYIHVQISL